MEHGATTMPDKTRRPIVIAGAGSIGCYAGGCLALAGRHVRFLARPRIVSALTSRGLRLTDLEGRDRFLAPGQINATHDPAVLADAGIVLVTVKSGATEEMAANIARFTTRDATVISLQNGVGNAAVIAKFLGAGHPVFAAMVPFNVVLDEHDGQPLRAHRATGGDIVVDAKALDAARALSCEGLKIDTATDMASVLWGKLLLNLNNALNALSGLPLATELADRRWRRLLATQMDEALAAMKGNGIRPAKLAAAPPGLLPTILRLPDWLFSRIASRMLAIDPEARSSTWEDLKRGRPTEVNSFQGEVLRLAAHGGVKTPLTERILSAIRQAEANKDGPPALKPSDLWP